MNYRCILAAAAALSSSVPALAAESVIIDHVTVIDGTGRAPQADMTVIIEGDRIAAVRPSPLARDENGQRIDGRGKFLIPGLMDVHINNVKSIAFVMKNGQIIDESKLLLAGGGQPRRFTAAP